ncbi:MAG: threonylcarbamoyl-AMP synthase [Myxococcales bacterium]|nr:threonylcarbamoyl-AMP synthase [Myxococcales bacterium]
MLRLVVHPEHPEPRKLAHAVQHLRQGGVCAYPTDTVYALGCDFEARKAVLRLYEMKGMEPKQPLALLLPDLAEIARYGRVSDSAYRLMKRLVPGPYTFILEATREVPRALMIERNKRRTVGVRVPDHPVAQALLAAYGRPILSTTATGPDHAALGDPNEVRDLYGHALDVLIDGGHTETDVSTVLALYRDEVEVIRVGKGSIEGLES